MDVWINLVFSKFYVSLWNLRKMWQYFIPEFKKYSCSMFEVTLIGAKRLFFIYEPFYLVSLHIILNRTKYYEDYMEPSESKWVNLNDIQYGVNSLRLESLHIM